MTIKVLVAVIISLSYAPVLAQDWLAEYCGPLENAFGPFDYRDPKNAEFNLPIVEKAHFTTEVESLIRGKTESMPGGDIDYTLRAFPNHHRALFAMASYGLMHSSVPPPGSGYSVDCWFDRAKRFTPDDGMVWLILGIYESKRGNEVDAEDAYLHAIKLMPDNAEGYYNLALLQIERGNHNDALANAKTAYKLGHPLPGLRKKLERLKVWSDDVSVVSEN